MRCPLMLFQSWGYDNIDKRGEITRELPNNEHLHLMWINFALMELQEGWLDLIHPTDRPSH